jgi:hypothetical protein
MTLITAIQLNDNIVITSDNRSVSFTETKEIEFDTKDMQKMYAWDQEIITGTGESYVISRTVEFFIKLTQSNLDQLTNCLDVSKLLRHLEIGWIHKQVKNSKLLCSSYSKNGAQLYAIQRFDDNQKHRMTELKPMQIVVWLFHPNVDIIAKDLQNLHHDLKDYSYFENKLDWINYYLNRISPIYQKQSLQDPLMSQSFDFFFQKNNEYVSGHIPNTPNTAIEFKEISICHNP